MVVVASTRHFNTTSGTMDRGGGRASRSDMEVKNGKVARSARPARGTLTRRVAQRMMLVAVRDKSHINPENGKVAAMVVVIGRRHMNKTNGKEDPESGSGHTHESSKRKIGR